MPLMTPKPNRYKAPGKNYGGQRTTYRPGNAMTQFGLAPQNVQAFNGSPSSVRPQQGTLPDYQGYFPDGYGGSGPYKPGGTQQQPGGYNPLKPNGHIPKPPYGTPQTPQEPVPPSLVEPQLPTPLAPGNIPQTPQQPFTPSLGGTDLVQPQHGGGFLAGQGQVSPQGVPQGGGFPGGFTGGGQQPGFQGPGGQQGGGFQSQPQGNQQPAGFQPQGGAQPGTTSIPLPGWGGNTSGQAGQPQNGGGFQQLPQGVQPYVPPQAGIPNLPDFGLLPELPQAGGGGGGSVLEQLLAAGNQGGGNLLDLFGGGGEATFDPGLQSKYGRDQLGSGADLGQLIQQLGGKAPLGTDGASLGNQFGFGQNPGGQFGFLTEVGSSPISIDPVINGRQQQRMINDALGNNAALNQGSLLDAQNRMAGRGMNANSPAIESIANRLNLNQAIADTGAQTNIPIQVQQANAAHMIDALQANSGQRAQDINAYSAINNALANLIGAQTGQFNSQTNRLNAETSAINPFLTALLGIV